MKKHILLFMIISWVFGGTSTTRFDTYLNFWHHGMEIESYHASGFSDITQNQASNICSGNPASLTAFISISAGFSYDYSTEMKNFIVSGISARKDLKWYPRKVGLIFPVKNSVFGLTYHQKYNFRMSFGDIEVECMDGSVTTEYYSKSKIESYSAIAAFPFKNLIKEGDKLSIGAQISIDSYKENYDWLYDTEAQDVKNTSSWKFGAKYSVDDFAIGVVFEEGYYVEGKYKFSGHYLPYYMPTHYIGQLPDKLAIGCNYRMNEKLSIASTVTQVFWNVISGYKNSLIFSAKGVYQLSQEIQITFGVYNAQRYFDFSKLKDEFNYSNINIGMKYAFRSFQITAMVADSHLLSSDSMKYTRFQLGLDYQLK